MVAETYYYQVDISGEEVTVYRVHEDGTMVDCTNERISLASEDNRTYLNTRSPNGQRVLMKVSKKWTDEAGITWAAGELIVNGASTKTEKELFDTKGWQAL